MKTLTYLPVNWVNGLKLTSKHFFANQYSQTEALNREAGRSLTSYNYGLGEVLEGIGDNLEIEISGDTMSTLCVRLEKLQRYHQRRSAHRLLRRFIRG